MKAISCFAWVTVCLCARILGLFWGDYTTGLAGGIRFLGIQGRIRAFAGMAVGAGYTADGLTTVAGAGWRPAGW